MKTATINFFLKAVFISLSLIFISSSIIGCQKSSNRVIKTPSTLVTTHTPTCTPLPTHTPTSTPTATLSPTATFSPTATPTVTPTATPFPTSTAIPTATSTPSPTATPLIAWNQIKDTVQLEIETQIKKESPWSKFFTERVELTMKAIVKAGIPGIADSRVVMNADKVEVTLPRAMILNVNPVTQEFGNIKKYPFYSNIENLEKNAREEALGKITVSAIQNKKILGAVEIKVKQQLHKQLQSFGFKTIVIVFEPKKSPIEIPVENTTISIEEYGSREIVIARSIVPINNCNGSALIRVNKRLGEHIGDKVFEGSVESIKLEFPKYLSVLETGLEKFYATEHEVEKTEDSQVELQAAPGTNIVYTVIWKKTRSYGLVKFIKDDQIITRYYIVEHNLIGGVEGAKNIGCQ